MVFGVCFIRVAVERCDVKVHDSRFTDEGVQGLALRVPCLASPVWRHLFRVRGSDGFVGRWQRPSVEEECEQLKFIPREIMVRGLPRVSAVDESEGVCGGRK